METRKEVAVPDEGAAMGPLLEGQDWQRECRVCKKVKCPKPEKVGEWMRDVLKDSHAYVFDMVREGGFAGWRWQVGCFEASLESAHATWSRNLDGVCNDCLDTTFPDEAQRYRNPELVHEEACQRWRFVVPWPKEGEERARQRQAVLAEVESFSEAGAEVVRLMTPPAVFAIKMKDGTTKDVPCVWLRGGLAVVMCARVPLEDALIKRAAGNASAYPCEAWVVTHVESGAAIISSFNTAAQAIEVAHRMVSLVDWTRPMVEVGEQLAANPEATSTMHMLRLLTESND